MIYGFIHPKKNTWTQLPSGNALLSKRSKPTGWLVDNKLYIFAGVNPAWKVFNDLWSYDFKTQQWKELIATDDANSPPPRHESLGGVSSTRTGKLVIYGGEGQYDKSIN